MNQVILRTLSIRHQIFRHHFFRKLPLINQSPVARIFRKTISAISGSQAKIKNGVVVFVNDQKGNPAIIAPTDLKLRR